MATRRYIKSLYSLLIFIAIFPLKLFAVCHTLFETDKITITFQIKPSNAKLEVNGDAYEVDANGTAIIQLLPGQYEYRVSAVKHKPQTGVITVDKEEVTENVTLKPNFGLVNVIVQDGCEIWLDGYKRGSNSLTFSLKPDQYLVESKKNGCRDAQKEFTVIAGQTQTIELDNQPVYGALSVTSEPLYADVYIDNSLVGQTPLILNDVPIGKREVSIRMKSYASETHTVTIVEDEPVSLDVQLKPVDKGNISTTGSDEKDIFEIVERNASFPGGDEACYNWIAKHIKYPKEANERGISGKVYVRFVVERDGRITDVSVLSSPHPLLSEEAIRVCSSMPRWTPASSNGKTVRSRINLPIKFGLLYGKKSK